MRRQINIPIWPDLYLYFVLEKRIGFCFSTFKYSFWWNIQVLWFSVGVYRDFDLKLTPKEYKKIKNN